MPQWGKIVRLHGQVSQSLSFHECFLLPLPMQSHPSLSPKCRNLRFTASFSVYLLFLYLGSCFDPFPEVNFFVFLFCFVFCPLEEKWKHDPHECLSDDWYFSFSASVVFYYVLWLQNFITYTNRLNV